MKTKQKEDKTEDDPAPESSGKTRARKKLNAEEKSQESEKETTRKRVGRKPAAIKKRPLGISKTLRSKKTVIAKDKVKAIAKPAAGKQVKPIRKLTPRLKSEANEEKPAIIPASEIKKEPLEEPAHGSRSSSPKTSGPRRQRLTSDIQMMRSTLAESPTSLLLGSRTSPYSMRSERSNSPFRPDAANLRSGRQRKLKNNLLNEIVKNEQKKRRLGSDGKPDVSPDAEDAKKLKRGRSFSRDGSELSATESDLSLCEASTDTDRPDKEVKTELDLEEESPAPTPATLPADAYKVPSAVQCKSEDTGTSFSLIDSNKIQTVKRSTSLDSDNNNRMKVDDVPSAVDNKAGIDLKTENALFAERDTILTNMSKTFNTKEMTKNIRKARRGRKVAAPSKDKKTEQPIQETPVEDSFSKEINDLIETLERCDRSDEAEKALSESQNVDSKVSSPDANIKSTTKFYSLQPATVVDTLKAPMDKVIGSVIKEDTSQPMETVAPEDSNLITKEMDDAENIRLQISDEDSQDKTEESTKENVKTLTAFKPSTQDIDKLMDKLKHFEELDKKRQLELKAKTEAVMVTDDVVLIPKSGADIKPLKDIQATISADRVLDKGSVLSCFQNNSAISIVTKRDHVRKSIDHDLPNSITLIKRNSSSRKESTGSNSGDAISIIEKSLGKDVTLTELRRSIDKPNAGSLESAQTLHSLATIQPNKPGTVPQSIATITPSLSVLSKDQPQTNGSETSKIVRKHERRPAILNEDSSEKTKLEAVNNSVQRIMSPPLPVEISVKPHIAEPIKSPLRTMKSPPLEIISVQPLLAEASKPVTQDTSVAVTVVSVISTDLPKDIIINADKSITSTVTSPSIDVKITATPLVDTPMKDDVAVKTSPAIVIKPDIKIPPDVKIPPPEIKIPPPEVKIPPPAVKISPPDVKIPPLGVKIPPPDLKVTPPDLKITPSDLKITPSDLKITPSDLKITPPDVKIPQPETPKEAVTSPRGDDRKPKSETKSPHKVSTSPKETAKLPSPARTSTKTDAHDAVPGTSGILLETPERQKRKESILRTLGLLTLKAADEAKIEKQKQKEMFATKNNKSATKMHSGESSGTLRTVIKLNRGLNSEKKSKNRSSLKMTFQKAKVRAGKPSLESGELSESDDTYYTIHKEGGTTAPVSGSIATGGHRKSHNNRFNNHDGNGAEQPAKSPEPGPAKEVLNLVIPEKASSFSIHPGRLCQDQCFYCGGNFGLFDTPCHIAQMKSAERQKKVLDNEEKLTMDSCLCDACYRHVDRRANCPSYRKRPNLVTKPPAMPHMGIADGKSKMSEESSQAEAQSAEDKLAGSGRAATCHAEGCSELADHSIRRKWLIKMRTSVNRVVKLQLDYPGLHTIPLCVAHYRPVSQLMVCALCRRRLTKHHNIHFINHPLEELNPRLAQQGVPVSFAEKPAVCKLCRYFCTLLFRPHQQLNKKHFLKLHRRRLLQTYNMEVPEDSEPEATAEEPKEIMDVDPNVGKQKKKNKSGKSKQRKSTEHKYSEETPDNPDKDREPSAMLHTTHPMEEDIESLISTNKISKGPDVNPPSDNSDADTVMDVDATLVPSFDKQSELQYLLQKQNNPAQFLQVPVPNLTQKQRNVLKAHNASAIQKPATQAKICEKNAKRIQKLGQVITQKEKSKKDDESSDGEKKDTGSNILKNISLTDECTIESIPPRKAADIAVLKNKWQMSESFTQVKRNLSELSKNVDKPKSRSGDSRYSNPVRRLETNPSISVRELFPGEDEMNLQCSIEFNNVKGVTPEGWEKCNTTIQYDVETRKLWNELQKPYGNQSSFLRHLVLLEKYFRSGDLVLAPNANGHAINYSDSVQSRLRAYDNVPEPPKRTQPAVSLIEYRKHKTSSGKSLLKSNQSADVAKSSEPKLTTPPPMGKSPELPSTSKHLNMNYGGYPPMPSPAVFAKPKSRSLPSTSMAMIEMRPPAPKQKSAPPPELISIHTPTPQGRKSIENVLKNIQQLVKGVSAPEPDPIPAPALPPPPPPPPPPLPPPPPPHKETVKKQKTTTKPWRPTLMQITQENLARIAREPTQVAVDGRSLPSLVQVMSGGQRYHITLADYNKMCIMRREKLQQVQVVENSAKTKKPTTEVVTEIQPSTTHGNGGTVTQNVTMSENHTTDSPTVSSAQTRSEEAIRAENNAVNILKNVGLKNITIAPVVEKAKPSATVTSQSVLSPVASSPSLIITSTPMKMPQLGPSVTITSDTLISPGLSIPSPMLPSYGATIQPLVMPKIPKSLTVIPQTVPVTSTVVNLPASLVSMQPSYVGVPPSTVVSVPVSMSMSAAQYPMVAPPVAPQP